MVPVAKESRICRMFVYEVDYLLSFLVNYLCKFYRFCRTQCLLNNYIDDEQNLFMRKQWKI
jgi:hypothetical protein